jgi:hypothetical protein
MASNDNDKRKMDEEMESSMVRKRLRHTDDDGGDDDTDSSDSPEEPEEEEEMEVEVPSEETSMNQLNISQEKLYARRTCNYLFDDNGDTPSSSPDTPSTPESRWCSDEESSDDDGF